MSERDRWIEGNCQVCDLIDIVNDFVIDLSLNIEGAESLNVYKWIYLWNKFIMS